MKKYLLILFFLFNFCVLGFSATYYISPTGNDTTGDGTTGTPWLTLNKAFSQMSGGDTLIIKDGTYTGTNNQIITTQYPPYGSAGNYTIIKAENDGGVLFDGENVRPMLNYELASGTTNVYWQFEGIIYGRSNWNAAGAYHSGYITMLRCGAYDAANGNAVNFGFGTGCDYILLEGCYAWGGGRYKFLFGTATNSIMRNCVGRLDRVTANDPTSVFTVYSSSDVEVQNCIAIDSDQTAYYNADSLDGCFQTPSTSGNADSITFRQCIGLNSTIGAMSTSGNEYNRAADVTFQDCVFWDCSKDGGSSNMVRGLRTELLNCTIGFASGINYPYINSYDGIGYNNDTTIKNSILWSLIAVGGAAEPYAVNDIETTDYNAYYGNTNNFYRTTPGANDLTATNPIYNMSTNATGSLKYIIRIETTDELANSNLATAGESGVPIGANCRTLVGTSGTIWGESGYNTDTGISMWPFPNEALIRTKMKVYSYDSGNLTGDRGFCVNGETLTKYIWEYLGNDIPTDIYGEDSGAGFPTGITSTIIN